MIRSLVHFFGAPEPMQEFEMVKSPTCSPETRRQVYVCRLGTIRKEPFRFRIIRSESVVD